MAKRTKKRSQQIHLLLLGAATLAGSGCQHLDPIQESSTLYNTEAECTADWGSGECSVAALPGNYPDVLAHTYWFYDPLTSVITDQELVRDESNPADHLFLTKVVGRVAREIAHVLRGGFGSSASRFGGAYA